MSILDTVYKNWMKTIASSDAVEDTKMQLTSWLDSEDGKHLATCIVTEPSKIDECISKFKDFCMSRAGTYASILNNAEVKANFKSFAEFEQEEPDTRTNVMVRAEDKDGNKTEMQMDKELKEQEELSNDIERTEEPEEPDLDEVKAFVNLACVETASIKPDKYDWYTFSGTRKKTYSYGNKKWTLSPGGIVGISKACNFQNKHSFCILDQSKTHTIDLTKHNADLLKKRCKQYKGNIANIVTPTPNSGRSAVASVEEEPDYITNFSVECVGPDAYEYTPKNNKELAINEMVDYLSNLFKIKPSIEGNEETPFAWDTSDGVVTLVVNKDANKFVVAKK